MPCDHHDSFLVSNRSSPLFFSQQSTLSGEDKENDSKKAQTQAPTHTSTKAMIPSRFAITATLKMPSLLSRWGSQ